MCGIAGFSLSPTDNNLVNSKRLARALLLDIESRGKDATGFAFMDPTGAFQVHKAPKPASEFVPRGLCIPKKQPLAIMHTRAATKGSKYQNVNNHPIPQGDIVGVHNGWFDNDELLWGAYVKPDYRRATVDSEVVFALLAHGGTDANMTIKDALELPEGNMAVAWLDRHDPAALWLARGSNSPLFVGQTEGGSVIFASTESAIADGAEVGNLALTHIRDVPEGTLIRIVNGDIKDVSTFDPQPGWGYGGWSSHKSSVSTAPKATTNVVKSAAESAKVFLQDTADLRGEAETCIEDIAVLHDQPIGEAPWWSERWMAREYFTPTIDPPFSTEASSYYTAYWDREEHIDSWLGSFRGEAKDFESAAELLKAFVRPGDYIRTELDGRPIDGEVLSVPSTFPAGNYLLRLFVPIAGWKENEARMEVVLCERTFDKFSVTASRQRPMRALTA